MAEGASDERADASTPSGASAGSPIFIEPAPAVEVYYPEPDTAPLDVSPRPYVDHGLAGTAPDLESDSESEPEFDTERQRDRVQVRAKMPSDLVPPPGSKPMVQLTNERSAAEILSSHVAMNDDEWGFLPCLRRGEAVPAAKVTELEGALLRLEVELRGSTTLDRRIAHGLYRLALESQVLLTDAWPGVFDARVIQAIRTVQEAVERILSDQDIRFYANATRLARSDRIDPARRLARRQRRGGHPPGRWPPGSY